MEKDDLKNEKQCAIHDVSDSYDVALISIDSLISRLKALKTTMNKKKFIISKLTWDDTKILYDKQYTKNIDEFFNEIKQI
jgi:predicted amino acid racemase